jgi:hypothetical protein
MVTITLQGRTYTWPGIRILDEDYDDYARARAADAAAARAAAGGNETAYLRVPQPPAWNRFHLDMDGVARNVLDRVGLWCPDCSDQMKVSPLRATRNDAKVCNSVCQRATSITCDCSCGGKNHGRAWLAQSIRP